MNVWKKIKNVCIVIGALLLALLPVRIRRNHIDRIRSERTTNILDQCSDNAARAAGQNSGIAEELTTSAELADGIAEDNRHAAEQLDNALRILEKAEERAKAEQG